MAAEPLPHDQTARHGSVHADEPDPARWAPRRTGSRRVDRQGRVVQSMAHKVTRPCRRSGCPAPARASLLLDYAGKQVTLVNLLDEPDPRFLEVCPSHAASMDVPRGWDLVDERDDVEAPTGPPTASEMGSSATVAVLAEALRRDDAPSTDEPAPEAPPPPSLTDPAVDHADPAVDPADPAVDPADPNVAGPAPAPPSGRIARSPSPADDDRQLALEESPPRRPRPVPAAVED